MVLLPIWNGIDFVPPFYENFFPTQCSIIFFFSPDQLQALAALLFPSLFNVFTQRANGYIFFTSGQVAFTRRRRKSNSESNKIKEAEKKKWRESNQRRDPTWSFSFLPALILPRPSSIKLKTLPFFLSLSRLSLSLSLSLHHLWVTGR
jgi:hypothetical protein